MNEGELNTIKERKLRLRRKIPTISEFTNVDFGEIRMFTLDNTLYIVANDVAKILGYQIPKDAIRDLVSENNKKLINIKSIEINNKPEEWKHATNMMFLTEAGLYQLVLKSKMPNAVAFSDWITGTVLPNLREFGYVVDERDDLSDIILLARIRDIISENIIETRMLRNQNRSYAELEEDNESLRNRNYCLEREVLHLKNRIRNLED